MMLPIEKLRAHLDKLKELSVGSDFDKYLWFVDVRKYYNNVPVVDRMHADNHNQLGFMITGFKRDLPLSSCDSVTGLFTSSLEEEGFTFQSRNLKDFDYIDDEEGYCMTLSNEQYAYGDRSMMKPIPSLCVFYCNEWTSKETKNEFEDLFFEGRERKVKRMEVR